MTWGGVSVLGPLSVVSASDLYFQLFGRFPFSWPLYCYAKAEKCMAMVKAGGQPFVDGAHAFFLGLVAQYEGTGATLKQKARVSQSGPERSGQEAEAVELRPLGGRPSGWIGRKRMPEQVSSTPKSAVGEFMRLPCCRAGFHPPRIIHRNGWQRLHQVLVSGFYA